MLLQFYKRIRKIYKGKVKFVLGLPLLMLGMMLIRIWLDLEELRIRMGTLCIRLSGSNKNCYRLGVWNNPKNQGRNLQPINNHEDS